MDLLIDLGNRHVYKMYTDDSTYTLSFYLNIPMSST